MKPQRRKTERRYGGPGIAQLAGARLAKLRRAKAQEVVDRVKPYAPHAPSPKQELFLRLDAEECFYGGAAGGGKSDALIEAALAYVDVPGYSAGIFRRTKADLEKPGSILFRARSWFSGTAARWDEDSNSFVFPSGATLHFGYGQSRQEIEDRYQGTEFQFIGIDEAGQWTEDAYTYLFSRLRRVKDVPVPLRMRAAGNPGGRGGEWVRRRFVEHATHGPTGLTVREYVKRRKAGQPVPDMPVFVSPPSSQALAVAELTGRTAQGAHFVPAYASDNPGLDWAEYMANLARLDPATRAQLEHGDWWAAAGGKFFQEGWFHYADAPPANLRPIVRAWDMASTEPAKGKDPDWTASAKAGVETLEDGSKRLWVVHVNRTQQTPGGVEKFVKGTAEMDGKRVPIVMEEEPGSSGKNNTHNYASRVLFGWTFEGRRKTGAKEEMWKPLSADAQNGLVWLVRGPWNEEFVRELCALTGDDSHAHDDMADAVSLARAELIDSTETTRTKALAKM